MVLLLKLQGATHKFKHLERVRQYPPLLAFDFQAVVRMTRVLPRLRWLPLDAAPTVEPGGSPALP
jgi:hypothetical protein